MASGFNLKSVTNLKSLLNLPIVHQLLFILGVAAGVTVGIMVYTSIREPIYRPLDYQINSQNIAAVVDTLDKAGIQYKVNQQDGLVYVAAKDIQLARLKLATAGVSRDDGFNFSYLNDQNNIGNSQFLENARYLHALESDLAKTISSLEGISAARVHIAIPQNNIFADENRRPTASVVLSMVPGYAADKERIRSIVQIVASSVPGLDPKDVSVTDQYGHLLSNALDEKSVYSTEQLSYQNNVQNYYEKRIESMIVPMLGDNKVSVRVHANIDFSQQEEASESFDPKQQVLRSEQTITEQNGGGGASGVPGSLSNTPPSNNQAKQQAKGGGEEKNESVKNYEVGKSVTYKKSDYAKVTNLSVAVVVGDEMVMDPKTHKYISEPISQDKLNKITELVKATIGYDQKRGDNVTVLNSSFNALQMNNAEGGGIRLWDEPWFWDLVKRLIGISIGIVFLVVIYRRISHHLKITATQKTMYISEDGNESETKKILGATKEEQLDRLKRLANQEPSRVALIIKNWVGKP